MSLEDDQAADARAPLKSVTITFDPIGRPEEAQLYSDAGASDLVPVLRSVLARLESGELRMPLAGTAWMSCEPESTIRMIDVLPGALPAGAPGYWMNETGGVLRPALEALLSGEALAPDQVAIVRAYIRQWINAPVWIGPMITELRVGVDAIQTQADVERWLEQAEKNGIDPL